MNRITRGYPQSKSVWFPSKQLGSIGGPIDGNPPCVDGGFGQNLHETIWGQLDDWFGNLLPPGDVKIACWKWTIEIEIEDLPIKMVSFHIYVSLPEAMFCEVSSWIFGGMTKGFLFSQSSHIRSVARHDVYSCKYLAKHHDSQINHDIFLRNWTQISWFP